MRLSSLIAVALVSLLGLAGSTHAGTNGFFSPFFRGQPVSQAGYWERFTVPFGPPGNLPDRAGATTDAVLTQSDSRAFLTGTDNIYNLDGTNTFTLADSTLPAVSTIVVQTRSLGSEIEYATMNLTYVNGSGTHTLASLPRVELNRGTQTGLGALVSSLWQWDLSGLNATAYTITFSTPPSTSFDALTLDTWDQFKALFTVPFNISDANPAIERWMYANNAAPCDRPAGSVFGTFGDEAGVDTRHAQHLVGWDTAALAPTNRGPAAYLVTRCRVTLTINRGNLFAYDPTHDSYRTYLDPSDGSFTPDTDTGRPVELFGVGYRNGYTVATFDQCAPFGTNAPEQRNAYAAGWGTNGRLIDVSNNVGKTNEAYPPFEAVPFAVGTTANAASGQLVPSGATIAFDLNLNDPLVLAYIQSGLHDGRLRFMLSSLHTSDGQLGAPKYPDFATRFNEAVFEPTRLEIEGVVVGDGDVDSDGLPDDWELFYLHGLTANGAGDSDQDGAANGAELRAGTDPMSGASCLKILAVDRDSSGRATVSFPYAASRRYWLEHTEDFQGWKTLTNEPVFDLATGQAHWVDDTAQGGIRIYRVRCEMP